MELLVTPEPNMSGSTEFTVYFENGGLDQDLSTPTDNESYSRTVSLTITPVNDAPVLKPEVSLQLPTLNEDDDIPVGPVGALVSELIDSGETHNNFSDPDGDLPGIAITATNLQGGKLYYSIDNGSTWTDVGPVTATSARLLHADNKTRLAFKPSANFHGSISDVFTFKAWDRSDEHSNGSDSVNTTLSRASTIKWNNNTSSQMIGDIALSPDGKTAYVVDYYRVFKIFDVDDPEQPVEIGNYDLTQTAQSIAISPNGNFAYIAQANGLNIFDISDPTNPSLITWLPGYAHSVELSTDGTTAYVGHRWRNENLADLAGLRIIDVSNPSSPQELGKFMDGDLSGERVVAISPDGTTAYLGKGTDGVSILDITAPENPTLTKEISTGGWVKNLTISPDGSRLFVSQHQCQILDVSDPTDPSIIATIDPGQLPRQAVAYLKDNQTAYVVGGAKFYIFNDIHSTQPILHASHILQVGETGQSMALSADEKVSYVAALGSVAIFRTLENFSQQEVMVSVAVNPENDPPPGALTINGSVIQGQTLTVSDTLADIDGLSPRTYQWSRNGTEIAGAVQESYTLVQDDVGKKITVSASYTDNAGTLEIVTSEPTALVENVNDLPILDPTASPHMVQNEDPETPTGAVGTLVSELIDSGGTHDNFNDPDGDLPGIAITGTNLQGGTLWASTNNGTDWHSVHSVSDESPTFLEADSKTRLFFEPAPKFFWINKQPHYV